MSVVALWSVRNIPIITVFPSFAGLSCSLSVLYRIVHLKAMLLIVLLALFGKYWIFADQSSSTKFLDHSRTTCFSTVKSQNTLLILFANCDNFFSWMKENFEKIEFTLNREILYNSIRWMLKHKFKREKQITSPPLVCYM